MDCEDVHRVSVYFENDVCVVAPVTTESSAEAAQSDAPSMSNNSSSSSLKEVSASGSQESEGTKNRRSKNIPSTSSTGAKVKQTDADRKKTQKMLNRNQFYCDSCKVVLGIGDARCHALGKQHKAKGVSKMRYISSITVTGFNPDTTEDILYDYFSSFGLVKTVFISREEALFAAIEFETLCSITHCTECYYFVHRLNNSDLTVTKGLPWTDTQNMDSNSQETSSEVGNAVNARKQKCRACKVGFAAGKSREHYLSKQHALKAYYRLRPSYCVTVKRFHQDTGIQAFHDYFSRAGIVTLVVIFYRKYALIEFSQKCSVRHATDDRSAPHILGGCELVVYAGIPFKGVLPDIPFHLVNDSTYQYCISNKKNGTRSSVPEERKSEPDEMKNVATCSEKALAKTASAFVEELRRKKQKKMDTWTVCQVCSAFISPDDRQNHYLSKKHTKKSIPLMKENHCVLLVNCPTTLTEKNLYDYFKDNEKVQTIDMRRSMEGLVVIEFENEYPLKDMFASGKPVTIGGTNLTLLRGTSLNVAAQGSTVSHDDKKCHQKTIAPCSKSRTTNSTARTLASLIENEFKNAMGALHIHKSAVKTFAGNLEPPSINDSVPNKIMNKSLVRNGVINKNSIANDEIVKSSAPNDKIMKYSTVSNVEIVKVSSAAPSDEIVKESSAAPSDEIVKVSSAVPSDEIVIESPPSPSDDWIVMESSDVLSDDKIVIESSDAPSDEIVIESSTAPSDDEIVIESSSAANDKKEPKRKPVCCDICGSFLAPEEVRTHNLCKKHVDNAMQFLNVKSCITVMGFPKGCKAEKLYDYFSQFGKVDAVKIFKKNKGALVGFHHEKSARSVAGGNSNLEFERHQLSVKLGHPSIYGRGKPLESLPPHDDLMASLRKCKTVELQIACLQSSILLSKRNMQARLKLCRSLQKILGQYLPRCSFSLFGSSVNSFGTKGSDVDILFEADFEECFKDRKEEQVCKNKISSPRLEDVVSGRLCADDLTELPKIVQLDLIKKILRKEKNGLYAVTFVPAVTCPIVKFVSSKFGLSCDISNGNRLAVYNSALLETFGKLDERVIPLVTTLRYWAKKYDYISKHRFSSYAFTLMVIFFLQTRDPCILPSVEYLRSCTDKKVVVAGVDCSFCNDVEKIKHSANCETIENLLFEFFKYYGQFEYSKFVISPLTGHCELLELLDLCNPSGSQVFKVGAVCIQDPFLVYRNVSSAVKEESLRRVIAHMRTISMERDLYFKKQESQNGLQSGIWGIPQIFEAVPKDLIIPTGLLNPPNPFTMAKIILDEVIVNSVKKKYGINCTQCINLSEIVVHEVCCLVIDVLHMFLFVTEIIEDERDIREWALKAKSFSCTCVETFSTANDVHSEKLDGDLSEASKSSDPGTLDEQLVENSLDLNGRSSASVTSQDSDTGQFSDEESNLETAGVSDAPSQASPKIPVQFDVSKHEPFLSLYFTVAFQTWVCRKKYRKQCDKELGAFEIEKWVSQRIAEEKSLEVTEPAKFKYEFYDYYGYAAPVLYLKVTPPKTKRWKPLTAFLKEGLQKHVSCLLSS